MLRIRLSDADRERLGCVEWLDYDPNALMLSEAEILDDAGIDPDIRWGDPVLDEQGKPELTEKGAPKRRIRPGGQRVIVWMALRRSGVDVPIKDLDFDAERVLWQVVEPGKAESETSDSDSPPPSPASTTSRRRTSAA